MTRTFRLALILAGLTYCVLVLLFTPFADWLELKSLSLQFAIRGDREVASNVTVVQIDPRSLRHYGGNARSPMGLGDLARALDRIATAKPKIVLLDLGFYGDYSHDGGLAEFERALTNVPTVLAKGVTTYIDTDIEGRVTVDYERLRPPGIFVERAADTVLMMAPTNRWSVVTDLNLSSNDRMVPLERYPLLAPLQRFFSPTLQDPGDDRLINYYGMHSVPNVPIYQLTSSEHEVPPDYFRDRVVLVGGVRLPESNPNGGDDSFLTPISDERMYGVFLHANVAQNLIDGSWISRFPLRWENAAHAVLAGLFAMTLPAIGVRRGWLLMLAIAAVWMGVTSALFSYQNWLLRGATLIWVVMPAVTLGYAAVRWISTVGEHEL